MSGKVLIIEMVLPEGNAPHPGWMLDILDMMMLLGPGGQERTEAQYRDLLGKAGLALTERRADRVSREHRRSCAGLTHSGLNADREHFFLLTV